MDVIMETLVLLLLFAKLIKMPVVLKFACNLISQVFTILKLAAFGTHKGCGLLLLSQDLPRLFRLQMNMFQEIQVVLQ